MHLYNPGMEKVEVQRIVTFLSDIQWPDDVFWDHFPVILCVDVSGER